ncbi:exonuclease SbcCD subunit D [Microbispora triticiradicis]|uniref:Nuclease SbcCD subunit D n=3 Tax=Microbispora TaxID=2005 RepID=A0ABY3LW75_9ACTN|nr:MULTISPECIES: exonuclease SbcCD subunit D [Microbispora]RGA01120.1 exonuclease SbcCD subunit D [Microbispora triticiradicis]TLP63861.1 exonuclease SbcCD subunit D [Microbispora fusca]TYB57531.1 exonuclease SbcCD subunit D [Microbispora tritici]
MRVLHTSDWHLGRSFHRESLLGAQAAFVDHLVETVRAERVDVVLVSGDVYDRALPPVDAVALCNEALARLKALGAHTVLISGNHDSAVRLGFGADLMERVHLRTDPARAWDPVTIGDVAFFGIPYLEPELVRGPWELAERSHTAALSYAMERVRAHPAARRVVLAHAFVTGGEASDSERDISVGGVSHVPLSAFDGADYVALGHLHGRQVMSETVRYSGSPIAYSFSEAGHLKGSWLADLDGGRTEFVPAPVPRPVARLRGRIDDLLTDARLARHEDHWLQVTLTDPVRPREAMERLRGRFPHTLALAFEPDGAAGSAPQAPRIAGRAEIEVALDFVREVRGEQADDDERRLLEEAVEACRIRESA